MTLNHDSQESAEHRPSNGARNVNYKQNIHRTVVKDEGGNGAQWHSIPVGGRGEDGGWIRRPVSRVLCPRTAEAARGGDHSSRPPIAERLTRPTRTARAGDGPTLASQGAPSLFGLAPGGACHAVPVTRSAVRSYRTLSPLPAFAPGSFGGRFTFCGAIPGLAPGGRYPPPCRRGARTFLVPASPRRRRTCPAKLQRSRTATARPSDPARTWSATVAGSTFADGNLCARRALCGDEGQPGPAETPRRGP